jgi:hypothetical protein
MEDVARMGHRMCTELEGTRALCEPWRKWFVNIKMDLSKAATACLPEDWADLALPVKAGNVYCSQRPRMFQSTRQ